MFGTLLGVTVGKEEGGFVGISLGLKLRILEGRCDGIKYGCTLGRYFGMGGVCLASILFLLDSLVVLPVSRDHLIGVKIRAGGMILALG